MSVDEYCGLGGLVAAACKTHSPDCFYDCAFHCLLWKELISTRELIVLNQYLRNFRPYHMYL